MQQVSLLNTQNDLRFFPPTDDLGALSLGVCVCVCAKLSFLLALGHHPSIALLLLVIETMNISKENRLHQVKESRE